MKQISRASIRLLISAICVAFGMGTKTIAEDEDGDGLPDAVEIRLGTDPQLDDALQEVIQDGVRGRGDTSIRSDGKAPDVISLHFAHVGGSRYIWKVTFAEDYPASGTIFHLYVDVDNHPETGRQDKDWVRGVDMMYSMVDAKPDPRFIYPEVRQDEAIPVRMIVEGKNLYIADDLKMAQRDNQTFARMYILSQMKDPPSDSDQTEWITCQVPLRSNRRPPELPYPKLRNFDALSMPNLAELLHGLWKDPETVRLTQDKAAFENLVPRMNGDFDGSGAPDERASWECPLTGKVRIGVLIRGKSAGSRGLDVLVAGRKAGTAAAASARRDTFCFSTEPVTVSQGDKIELKTTPNSSGLTFGNVCLLKSVHEIPPLKIENLCVWPLPERPGEIPGRVMIAWTTNRPAEGVVSWGPPHKDYGKDEVMEEGRGFVNNHRVVLSCHDIDMEGILFTVTSTESEEWTDSPETALASYAFPEKREGSEVQSQKIRLSVIEPTKKARSQWPVSSGIPFPKGVLQQNTSCRLVGPDGESLPLQWRPLSWWGGSQDIQWLLVDFMAKTSVDEESVYLLHTDIGEEGQESPLQVKAKRTGPEKGRLALPVTVETGALTLRLEKGGFKPFAHIDSGESRVRGEGGVQLRDSQDRLFSTACEAPESVVLEAEGPVRATLCVKGRFANEDGEGFMRYLCRMHFYAGKSYVKTVFTLENDVPEPEMNRFKSLGLTVPFESESAQVGGAQGEGLPLAVGENRMQADALGERDAGWILAKRQDQSLAVLIRDYWQRYPKGLGLTEEGIRLALLPGLPRTQYKGANEDDLTKLYFWCDEGCYKLRTGVRITSEFVVDTEPPGKAGYEDALFWQSPLFAACSPDWYCESGAFGPMVPRKQGQFDAYEKSLDQAFEKFLARTESNKEYGFMNYGDWFGERTWNWGNIEYDTQWALAANFARTGDLRMLWRAEDAEWHNADVDTTHAAAGEEQVGRVWTHCVGHTGGYFPSNWKNMGWFNVGPRDTGHTWCQGHFFVYALTGEERYLETGRKVADWLTEHTTDFKYYSERNVGWPLIGLIGGYQVTGNPFYLNGAKLMADMAMWTQHPDTGGWGHWIDRNECKHEPRCWGCKPFMTGVLLHGLKLYDQVQPREDIQKVIQRNCDFLWKTAYIPEDNGFIYSQCKSFSSKGSTWTISLVGDGLAYGCLLDSVHLHKELLQRATEGFVYDSGVRDFGKSFTQGTCFMPQMLHDLEQLGVTEFPCEER